MLSMPVEIKQLEKNQVMKMNDKNIIEGNFLIAVFMGGKEVDWFADRVVLIPYEHHAHLGLPQIINIQNYLTWARACNNDNLKYHRSWDWIMPVYLKAKEEIKSRRMRGRNNSTGNIGNVIIHTGSNAVKDAGELILEGKCLEAQQKLVEAIKWYNRTKDK